MLLLPFLDGCVRNAPKPRPFYIQGCPDSWIFRIKTIWTPVTKNLPSRPNAFLLS